MTHPTTTAKTKTAQMTATQSTEQGTFIYGEQTIYYDIIRLCAPHASVDATVDSSTRANSSHPAKNKTDKITIKVHPDQRVIVTVPHNASTEQIQSAMLKRARWIWQSIEEFGKQKESILPRQYVSGETQFYLGRRYQLKVHNEPNQIPSVKLSRGRINVFVTYTQNSQQRQQQIKKLLTLWYKQRAKLIFQQRLAELLPFTPWVTGIPSIRIMEMSKQWGSCSTKGNLMLNPHLAKAPKVCIDYVILHELCHIAEHNHSEKFWRLLTQVMPNWKAIKNQLDGMAEMYLNG